MERAERFIVLGLGLLFNQLLVPVLWLMLVLTTITAVQRFWKVWRQASVGRPAARRRDTRARRRTARTARATRVARSSPWRVRPPRRER
jgi:CDP-diacylglycerol--glycerol-3-phosphate 3-phosphatidyltransferase